MLEKCHENRPHWFPPAYLAAVVPVESVYPEFGPMAWMVTLVLMAAFLFGYFIRRRETRIYQDLLEAEEAKLAAEGEFRATLYSMADAIITADAEGRVVRMNPVAERLTGWSEADAKERGIDTILSLREENGPNLTDLILAYLKTHEPPSFPARTLLANRNGDICPVSVSVATVKDFRGSTGSLVIVIHDRTAERDSERSMVESEDRLRRAVNILPLPVVIHAEDGEILLLNEAWTTVSEYAREELPTVSAWASQAHGTDSGPIHPGGEHAYAEEVAAPGSTVRSASGEILVWDYRSAPLGQLPDGRRLAITVAVDNTEREAFEHQLSQAMEDAQRSNRDLEQFAYVASHDLQEPLRMVASFTQLLSQRYGDQLDDKAQEYIAYAVDGAVRMQGLINDLLAYSRISTRGNPLATIDSHAVLGVALSRLASAIQETEAIVTNNDLPMVIGDASQLAQVFQNLLSNSLKYRGDARPEVRVSAEDKGDEWQFSVADNGIGFDMKFADRVFEIFRRLHTRTEYPGTGIGLAVCLKIVERHGGRMWAESSPGNGATFFFTLPNFSRETHDGRRTDHAN